MRARLRAFGGTELFDAHECFLPQLFAVDQTAHSGSPTVSTWVVTHSRLQGVGRRGRYITTGHWVASRGPSACVKKGTAGFVDNKGNVLEVEGEPLGTEPFHLRNCRSEPYDTAAVFHLAAVLQKTVSLLVALFT